MSAPIFSIVPEECFDLKAPEATSSTLSLTSNSAAIMERSAEYL